ncbi:MAG: glutamate--tRNA ligase [Janthinobacterium lividum]
MSIVTRFAPSPTGFLHIGSARTALFNWLYARHCGGQFLLRIEDTDRERSTEPAVEAILNGLKWLGLDWDGDVVYQFSRIKRHQDIVQQLLDTGTAYYCYSSPEELEAMREKARQEGRQPRYDGTWRDRDPQDAPSDRKPVVRLKVTQAGETRLQDLVQGEVCVQNAQLDDMILLRADGTPTYMLAVVVDDIDMNVSHIIRGDDHLTNTFRQLQIYQALKAKMPIYSHVPLIHGADGAKLSKRHGALGAEAYQDMGFLPEALCNYLIRLGWGHGDEEIITRPQAIDWFDIKDVGRAASRFDINKLTSLNAHYLRQRADEELVQLVLPFLQSHIGTPLKENSIYQQRLRTAMPGLKQRARTLVELAESALFLIQPRPISFDDKAKAVLTPQSLELLGKVKDSLENASNWQEADLEQTLRQLSEHLGVKMGALAQPLRAALTGKGVSPGIFEVMMALGAKETLERLKDVIGS